MFWVVLQNLSKTTMKTWDAKGHGKTWHCNYLFVSKTEWCENDWDKWRRWINQTILDLHLRDCFAVVQDFVCSGFLTFYVVSYWSKSKHSTQKSIDVAQSLLQCKSVGPDKQICTIWDIMHLAETVQDGLHAKV